MLMRIQAKSECGQKPIKLFARKLRETEGILGLKGEWLKRAVFGRARKTKN